MAPVITFLTDFGVADDFVGTCHGVMKRITPAADIIDITHAIQPLQVLQGSLVLANTLPYMPAGVHLAVVDPGVGTDRRAVVLRVADGRLFVGPDNGLLMPAADRFGGADAAWELTETRYQLQPLSRTFHGRDVFSPAAAHLAGGVDASELGPALSLDTLVRLDVPTPEIGQREIVAHVLIVDRFGNVQLNLTAADIQSFGIVPGTRIELEIGLERFYAIAARTFADVNRGDIVLYEDAYRNIAIAINKGAAAAVVSVRPGDRVRIRIRG
jgi:S-adenosyl-L-methionine hydrolase (adenosine-forming)